MVVVSSLLDHTVLTLQALATTLALVADMNETDDKVDVNEGDQRFNNYAPLYSILMKKKGMERFECVLTLVVNSKIDLNLPIDPYATMRPLHLLTTVCSCSLFTNAHTISGMHM